MPLDHPLVAERYFFPRHDTPADPFLVASGDAQLACWRRVVDADAPTLVHFHGNGEVVADYLPEMADAFAELGLNPFFAEYRGYGASTGEPRMLAMLDDVDAIFDAVGGGRVVVYGRSVGSIYALEMVHRHPEIAALVIESGIADPLERILLRVQPSEIDSTLADMEQSARAHLNHHAKLARYENPVLVLHAEHDHLVPRDNADRLAAWAGGDLRIFPSGDHNSILAHNGPAILAAVGELVASL